MCQSDWVHPYHVLTNVAEICFHWVVQGLWNESLSNFFASFMGDSESRSSHCTCFLAAVHVLHCTMRWLTKMISYPVAIFLYVFLWEVVTYFSASYKTPITRWKEHTRVVSVCRERVPPSAHDPPDSGLIPSAPPTAPEPLIHGPIPEPAPPLGHINIC